MKRVRLATGTSKSMKRFWPMVGPYIASRDVRKELNDNIYDDEQTVWFVMYIEEGRTVPDDHSVLGFCCARITDTKCELRHDYIREEFRGARRYSILFDARQRYLKEKHPGKPQEIVTNTKEIVEKVKKEGFVSSSRRGSYTVFRKEN